MYMSAHAGSDVCIFRYMYALPARWGSEVLPAALRLKPDHVFVSDPLPLPAMTSSNESPDPCQASGQGKGSIHGEGQVHGTGFAQGLGSNNDEGQGHVKGLGKSKGKGKDMPDWEIALHERKAEEEEMRQHPLYDIYMIMLQPHPVHPTLQFLQLFAHNGSLEAAELFLKSDIIKDVRWGGVFGPNVFMPDLFKTWLSQASSASNCC